MQHATRLQPNITQQQRRALEAIRTDVNIVIKPADKGLGLTVMDATWYDNEVQRQLSDRNVYTVLSDAEYAALFAQWRQQTTAFHQQLSDMGGSAVRRRGMGNGSLEDIAAYNSDAAVKPHFYIIPKLHKPVVVGRPIVAQTRWLVCGVARWLSDFLLPYMRTLPFVVESSAHYVSQLQHIAVPPQHRRDVAFLAFDITNLYTNLQADVVYDKMLEFCMRYKLEVPERNAVLCAVDLVLRANAFSFRSTTYQQCCGIAMGSAASVVLANITMSMLEEQVLESLSAAHLRDQLFNYGRYIDDGAVVATAAAAQHFLQQYSQLHPLIKLTHELSPRQLVFLDLIVQPHAQFVDNGQLITRLYQKPLNAYLYVAYSSYLPRSSFTGVIRGELIRYARCCANEADFITARQLLLARLAARGYPASVLQSAATTVQYGDRQRWLPPPPPVLASPGARIAAAQRNREQRRVAQQQQWQLAQQRTHRVWFKLPYNRVLHQRGGLQHALSHGTLRVQHQAYNTRPVISWSRGGPTVSRLLVRAARDPPVRPPHGPQPPPAAPPPQQQQPG